MYRKFKLRKMAFLSRGGLLFLSIIGPHARLRLRSNVIKAATVLTEDGVALTTQTDNHESIKQRGFGRYSLWGSSIYFSSSDGTNCRKNGRSYALQIPDEATAVALNQNFLTFHSANSADTLDIIARNATINNSVFSNYFRQVNSSLDFIGDYVKGFTGKTVLVVGSGTMPWTGLRFLAEGASEVTANDLFEVQSEFEPDLVSNLCDLVATMYGSSASANLVDSKELTVDGKVRLKNLVTLGGIGVEESGIKDESQSLIYSVSVLEHVMAPLAVYRTFYRSCEPGGLMYHSIDLRDHRDFSKPNAFLALTDEEYASINTENRLRASEHLSLIQEVGFEILKVNYQWVPRLSNSEALDWSKLVNSTSISEVLPEVEPDYLLRLDSRFKQFTPQDLATQSLQVLARKVY